MSRIPIKLKLVDTNEQIKTKILNSIYVHIERAILHSRRNIQYRIQTLVGDKIRQSPEYQSLLTGELQASFGLNNPQSRVDDILNIWINSIKVDYVQIRQRAQSLSGGLKISIIDESFKDVIGTSAAIVNTKNGQIPWLEWLLLAGNSILIGNYHISSGSYTLSRTGKAIMLPGGQYSVPSTYSGVKGSNWVTRALFGIEPEISKIIEEEIKNYI